MILAIETATRAGSVAIAQGERVLSSRIGNATVSHSSNLIEMIEVVLAEANATLSDVDLFAAAIGPGSFTGLRIGLATIKAFAACSGRKVAGVSTLAAIAHATGAPGQIVSVLPAGRGEVFAQMFSIEAGAVTPLDDAAHLTPRETLERYGETLRVRWAGEGVEKLEEYLRTANEAQPMRESMKQSIYPLANAGGSIALAGSVAALALKLHREGKSSSAEELHAEYVRASDAEINERWQQQKAQQSAQN